MSEAPEDEVPEQPPDALHVRCKACGAWCRASDEKTVDCAHCGASVAVPDDVRLFVDAMHTLELSAKVSSEISAQTHAVAQGAPVPRDDEVTGGALSLPEVEAHCARCGFPMRYGTSRADKERCPACGAESVASVGGTVRVYLGGLDELKSRHEQQRQDTLQTFPVATRIDDATWNCGACKTRLRLPPPGSVGKAFEPCDRCGKQNQTMEAMSTVAMSRAVAAGLEQRDPKVVELRQLQDQVARKQQDIAVLEARLAALPPVSVARGLRSFALAIGSIALFCYVGYRVDTCSSEGQRQNSRTLRITPPPPLIEVPSELPDFTVPVFDTGARATEPGDAAARHDGVADSARTSTSPRAH